MDTESVAIGIALLGIILGTWTCLYNINRKLDRLLLLIHKSCKKEEGSDHTSSTQANCQHSFTDTVRHCVKKCIHYLRGKIAFHDKERNQSNNIHQGDYTAKQLRFSRTSNRERLTDIYPALHILL